MSTILSIRCFIPGELEFNCPMPKELAWDTSTENFWLHVHSYKDPVGYFPFQLFSLGVLKMFCLPILNVDSKWNINNILKLWSEGKAIICSNINLYYVEL